MAKKEMYGMTNSQCELLSKLVENEGHKFGTQRPERTFEILKSLIRCNVSEFPNYHNTRTFQSYMTGMITSISNSGIYFPNKLQLLEIARSSIPPVFSQRDIKGKFGKVPSEIVTKVLSDHNAREEMIINALNQRIATGSQGQNGVKVVTTNAYTAELKIMSMGGFRIYSRSTELPYYFNIIGKHL